MLQPTTQEQADTEIGEILDFVYDNYQQVILAARQHYSLSTRRSTMVALTTSLKMLEGCCELMGVAPILNAKLMELREVLINISAVTPEFMYETNLKRILAERNLAEQFQKAAARPQS